MDKIIDGIDVSECNAYKDKHCLDKTSIMFTEYNLCSNFSDCYFKQLKRLEQENEQLKKSIDRYSEIDLLNAELQQTNKRLIARLRPLEDSYFNGLSSIEIAELAKKSIRITAENRKLEYALQEIRDIANGMHDWWINKTQYTDVYELAEHLLKTELNRILDEIDSVIGEK